MKKLTEKKEKTKLEQNIEQLERTLLATPPGSDAYREMVKELETLYAIKREERKNKVSKDTLALIAGNLVGIGMILSYEQLHVISSKALSFVIKGRP